ncbi:hypothetical protein, partial [Cyanobium sp. FACHB-13342]|uniref:hypothetical protein n=1 Tax=Cyanobium sp. FACHB-13342 TaxID=2692793 RepID=UPI00168065F8
WQWESAFGVELNDDGTTGYAAVDVVGGRLVRPIGAVYGGTYYIDRDGDGDTDDLLKLRNSSGVSYSDASSASWDAKGARAFGTGYQVLLDGTGAYEGQGLVWTTNSAGVITGSTGWLSGQSLWTWEDAFGFDVNADGALGDPNAYQPNPLLPIRTDLLQTTYLISQTDYRTSTTIESSGSRTDSFSYSYDYQYLLDAQDRPLAVKRDTIQLDSTYTQSGPDYVDYFYYIYGPSGIAVAEFFAEDNREGYIANPVELRRIVTVNVLDGGLIAAEKLVFSQGSLYAGSFGQSLSLSEAVGYRYESGPNGGIFNEAIENLPWPDPTTFDASVEIFGGVRQTTYTSTPMSFYDGRLVVTETGDSIGYDAVVFNPPSGDDEAGISFSVDLYEGGSDSLLRWLRSDVLFDSPSSALEIISGAYLNVFGAAEPSDSLLASRLVSQGSYGIGDDPYSRSVVYQYDSLTGLMTGFSESYRSEDPFGSYSSQTNIQATYSTGLSAEAQLIPDSSLLDAMSTQLAQTALLQFQWTPEQGLLFADLYTGL